MKLKKILKLGLPFIGLSAVAIAMPITLTSCSNANSISIDDTQATQIDSSLTVTLSKLSNENQISTIEQSLKTTFNMTGLGLSIASYVQDVKITIVDTSPLKQANVSIILTDGYTAKLSGNAKTKFSVSGNTITSVNPYSTLIIGTQLS